MNEHSEFSKKGDIMKKRIFIGLLVFFSLMIFFTYAYAIDIDGWWVAGTNFIQGNFQTGEWTRLSGHGKKRSFMYILDAHEGSYGGPASLFLWDDSAGGYIKETYPVIYIRNNVILLFGPTSQDADGNFTGNTIVLRPYGPIGRPYLLRGYYTLYDTENIITTDQFVRMGTLNMSRVDPKNVPKEVQDLLGAP
jgi:hypothetical protein